jgi:DNA repair exonuclease SbcCD ATPase subunit
VDTAIKKLKEEERDLNKELNLTRLLAQKPSENPYTEQFIRETEDTLQQLGSKEHDIDAAIDEIITTLKELEGAMNAYNEWARAGNALEVERTTIRKQLGSARATLAGSDKVVKPRKPSPYVEPDEYLGRQREYENVKKAVADSVCPTCKRPYDTEEAIAIKEQATALDEWLKENRVYFDNVLSYENAIEDYEREVEYKRRAVEAERTLSQQIEDLNIKIAQHAEKPVDNPMPGYRAAQEVLHRLDAQKGEVRSQMARLSSDLQHANRSIKAYEEALKKFAEHEARINTLERQVLVATHASREMTEYKQDLIANVVPSITTRASSLITEMTEGRYTEVSLTSQYDIEYRNDQGDLKSFANLSGGEKDVFALALRLAIADIKAGSVGVLVLDEVLESLDTGRQEATWEALERLSNRYNQIFLITHVESFKDRAPFNLNV